MALWSDSFVSYWTNFWNSRKRCCYQKKEKIFFSVEEQHDGKETNSVLYIPVGPDCPLNRGYLEKAKENFLAGENPPDFQSSCGSLEKDFRGRATLEDLNEIAKEMMGF